jgi:hypothetical protein
MTEKNIITATIIMDDTIVKHHRRRFSGLAMEEFEDARYVGCTCTLGRAFQSVDGGEL